MAETFRTSRAEAANARLVALSGRDLDDATRLLKLLTEASEASFLELPSGRTKTVTPQTLATSAREQLVERRRRRKHFPQDMFGEPAWEILLLLYVQKDGRRFTVTALAQALDLPQNSTGRWLRYLETAGLALRTPHKLDQRSIIAEVSQEGIRAVEAYFGETLET